MTVPAFNENVPAFTDRVHQWNGAFVFDPISALGLTGAEYVMLANNSRTVANFRLDVTVTEPVDVYVLWDRRGAPQPWLANQGFVDAGPGRLIGVDEGAGGTGPGLSIENRNIVFMRQNVPAGTFSTFEYNRGSHNMYGVVVRPAGSGLSPPPAFPEVRRPWFAHIDIGATGGRPEPGAAMDINGNAQIGAAASGVNNTNLAPRTMISYTGLEFTLALDNIDQNGVAVGALDWRDRGDAPAADAPYNQPLVRTGEDFVKNNGGVIRATLGNLRAGTYTVTSYHIDPDFDQADNIQILVDTGSGYADTGVIASARPHPGGFANMTTDRVLQYAATFSFTADGINPVRILFDARTSFANPIDTEVPLSGLSIVPEPSSLALAAMGLLVAGLAHVRRRRPRSSER